MLHFKLGNPVCRGSKNVNENVFGFQNEVSFIEVSRNFVIFDFIQPGNVASLVGKLGLFFCRNSFGTITLFTLWKI